MDIIRPISVEEVIGEFLKAELYSSRFRAGSLKALSMLGYNESLLEKPNYQDSTENKQRAEVLGLCRGWPDKELFTGFPNDTQWFYANMDLPELKQSYRLKSRTQMTDDERLLQNTARRVLKKETVPNIDNAVIKSMRDKIEQSAILPPIILVCEDADRKRVLIEGHSRSVAYCCSNIDDLVVATIMGISASMNKWAYF